MVKREKKVELLAPAGNLSKLKTAIAYGADAVYLGIPDFSLRVRINDFDLPKLNEGIEYAHARGVKVYVTVNIFAHNKHIEDVVPYLKELYKMKPDALIFSDPGVLGVLKEHCPGVDLHLSTQANCTNYAAAKFWYDQGVKRVILGRETSVSDMAEIKRSCPDLELECFVHGAMCMSYSGRCFLSRDFIDRSANLGDCVQPCRWEYDLFLKPRGHDKELQLVEDSNMSYLMNSKDLCLINDLELLLDSGISSFKIEGRAKSVYYLANVISMYKRALEKSDDANFLYQELVSKITNRGYTKGFLFEDRDNMQNVNNSHDLSSWEFCGQVIENTVEVNSDFNVNRLKIKVHNTIKKGDLVELVLPKYDIISLEINDIFDFSTGNLMEEAHGGGGGQEIVLEIKSKFNIPKLAVLRRKI